MRYLVVIHKDPDSDYGVTVPDLPGCFSAGHSMDDALASAAEAIQCHLEGVLADGEPLPVHLSVETHRANPLFNDALAWENVDIDENALGLEQT